MDEVKKKRGRPKKIKTCPEGKMLYEPTNRCRKIKEIKEPKPIKEKVIKEPKKRGRPSKLVNNPIMSPSIIPAPPAPPPIEAPPPILPLNNSSNYKKRIQKKSYIKPIKVIKQKKDISEMSNFYLKPSKEFIKLEKKIIDSSSKKRNILEWMYE